MCFSNLPIEFDEAGNPYLADEAEAVDDVPTPEEGSRTDGADVPIQDADPDAVHAEILATVPGSVRERLADGAIEQESTAESPGDPGHRDSAEGD